MEKTEMRQTLSWAVLAVLLVSCAASNQTSSNSTVAPQEPDCGFRSPTTCWTLGGRFPEKPQNDRAVPRESLDPPTAVALRRDSVSKP
jgi:hypothetical protein